MQAKYNCYQRGQHLRECDGQALYLAERVDRIVVAYADELFRKIKSEPYDKCSWFMMEEANYRNDQALHATAQQIFRNAIEAGWDEEYGGLLYFIDCLGKPTEAYEARHETVVAPQRNFDRQPDGLPRYKRSLLFELV